MTCENAHAQGDAFSFKTKRFAIKTKRFVQSVTTACPRHLYGIVFATPWALTTDTRAARTDCHDL
jgi:hypothetical protein